MISANLLAPSSPPAACAVAPWPAPSASPLLPTSPVTRARQALPAPTRLVLPSPRWPCFASTDKGSALAPMPSSRVTPPSYKPRNPRKRPLANAASSLPVLRNPRQMLPSTRSLLTRSPRHRNRVVHASALLARLAPRGLQTPLLEPQSLPLHQPRVPLPSRHPLPRRSRLFQLLWLPVPLPCVVRLMYRQSPDPNSCVPTQWISSRTPLSSMNLPVASLVKTIGYARTTALPSAPSSPSTILSLRKTISAAWLMRLKRRLF